MMLLTCEKCGSSEFIDQKDSRTCIYCRTRYPMYTERSQSKDSNITLYDDITMLLIKCMNDPHNARKYASLILDIDPTNPDAKKYF